eukprot:COSAG02_NODE_5183_length_4561_cov_2.015240_1_plen_183_part_10
MPQSRSPSRPISQPSAPPPPSSWGGGRGGALVWFVPFAVSCFLINPEDGKKTIHQDWFRAVMLTVGSFTAAYATNRCNPQTRREGLRLAAEFLVVNYILDLIVLVPLMIKEATGEDEFSFEAYLRTVGYWFRSIGASYTGFVTMCVVAGDSAERVKRIKCDGCGELLTDNAAFQEHCGMVDHD